MKAEEINSKLAEMGYRMKCELVRDHDETDRMADWSVTLTGPNGKSMETEFHTGCGLRTWVRIPWQEDLRKFFKEGERCTFSGSKAIAVRKYTKATPPQLADVLFSLLMDLLACDQSFNNWCWDCGYDTDSRKALETYLTCQESGAKLRAIGAKFDELHEVLQDW